MYWIAQPPIATVNFYGIAPAQPRTLSRGYRRLGERPGTRFVDGSASVANRDGTFVTAKVVCGGLRTLRLADGVHFTAAGAAWWGIHLARGIAHLERRHIDESCQLFDLVGLRDVSVTAALPPTEDSQEPRRRL